MKSVSLIEFLEDRNNQRKDLATALGVTTGAISQWLSSGKEVYILLDKKGNVVKAREHKDLPARRTAESV